MERSFDAILVGAGQAVPALAGRLTEAGWKIAVIERDRIGGTCVNYGCTPTKAMVASAKAAHTALQGPAYGFEAFSFAHVDLKRVKARKDTIVGNSRNSVSQWLAAMPGCTMLHGTATFEARDRIRLGDDILTAKKIFLNVGARPRIPEMPGADSVPFLTSTTILDLDHVPDHLIVVGGSFVGLEFAHMFRRFGSQVTVVERQPHLLVNEDEDVCAGVQEILEAEGIRFRLNANCIRLAQRDGRPVVHVDCQDGSPDEIGSHVLLAVGRVPNTDLLQTDKAGLKLDKHGFIEVDDQLRTSVEGIWALGDCNGRGAFTHTSYNDFEIAAANLLDGEPRRVSDRIPIYALYTDPPLGRVGMSERQVRERGKPAKVGMRPMTRVARAIEKGETHGFMKVLVDAQTDEILGATILGVGGDEAIHCIATAMYAGKKAAELKQASLMRHSVHIHPTVAELIPTVFGELKPI